MLGGITNWSSHSLLSDRPLRASVGVTKLTVMSGDHDRKENLACRPYEKSSQFFGKKRKINLGSSANFKTSHTS